MKKVYTYIAKNNWEIKNKIKFKTKIKNVLHELRLLDFIIIKFLISYEKMGDLEPFNDQLAYKK